MEFFTSVGGWAVAVVVAVISVIGAVLPKKGSLEHQMLDQQQERIKALEERIDRIEPMLIWYQRRDIAWERHVAQMVSGHERGLFPPWPERAGILREERDV